MSSLYDVLGVAHDASADAIRRAYRKRALLSHPDLRAPERLAHLGVDSTMEARRIPVGKFRNFSRALPIA